MKVNKLILILFFPVLAQLVFSCCCCDDDPVAQVGHSQLTGMNLFLVDNSGVEPKVLSSMNSSLDSISKSAFGIQANWVYSIFAKSNCKEEQFRFYNNAYACSCPDELYLQTGVVKSFKIVTLNDFDSSKSAGSDITSYFNFLLANEFTEIDQDSFKVGNENLMVMLHEPQLNSVHQFEISFELNDTLTFKDSTNRVILY